MQIKEWNFDKYLSKEDMAILVAKSRKRALEKKKTTFFHHGREIATEKFANFKKRKTTHEIADKSPVSPSAGKISESLLATRLTRNLETPANISYNTPRSGPVTPAAQSTWDQAEAFGQLDHTVPTEALPSITEIVNGFPSIDFSSEIVLDPFDQDSSITASKNATAESNSGRLPNSTASPESLNLHAWVSGLPARHLVLQDYSFSDLTSVVFSCAGSDCLTTDWLREIIAARLSEVSSEYHQPDSFFSSETTEMRHLAALLIYSEVADRNVELMMSYATNLANHIEKRIRPTDILGLKHINEHIPRYIQLHELFETYFGPKAYVTGQFDLILATIYVASRKGHVFIDLAKPLYERAIATFHELKRHEDKFLCELELAEIMWHKRDFDGAEKLIVTSLEAFLCIVHEMSKARNDFPQPCERSLNLRIGTVPERLISLSPHVESKDWVVPAMRRLKQLIHTPHSNAEDFRQFSWNICHEFIWTGSPLSSIEPSVFTLSLISRMWPESLNLQNDDCQSMKAYFNLILAVKYWRGMKQLTALDFLREGIHHADGLRDHFLMAELIKALQRMLFQAEQEANHMKVLPCPSFMPAILDRLECS